MPVYQWLWSGNYAQWEFIRLVMRESQKAWWDPADFPGWSLVGWAATAGRSHREQMFGGPVAQNVGITYTLTNDEKSSLAALGLNADELLARMNAHTEITAQRAARNHLAHYGTPNGDLRLPVVMMLGVFDPIVVPSNAAVYRSLVQTKGREDKLVQVFVNTWHGPYSADQYLAALTALTALEHWLENGVRPDASYFPESLGFNSNFVPPPWPY